MNLYLVLAGVYGFGGALLNVSGSTRVYNILKNIKSGNHETEELLRVSLEARSLIDVLSFCLIGAGFLLAIAGAFYQVASNFYGSIAASSLTLVLFYLFGLSVQVAPKYAGPHGHTIYAVYIGEISVTLFIFAIFILPVVFLIITGPISVESNTIVIGTTAASFPFVFPWLTLLVYTFIIRH